jgi:galactonate dehydratase
MAADDALVLREVKVYPLREPESGRKYTMVRLEARSGAVGWGECAGTTPAELALVRQVLATGIEATAHEVLWRKLDAAPGIRAGVNMAQLDIAGQVAKAPVYQVLGGPTRSKCRALVMLEGPAALERAQRAGFRAFGVPAPPNEWRNAGKAYVQKAGDLMKMMRRAAGPGTDFVLDGAGKLVPGDAQSVAAELESFHMLWFDEPTNVTSLGAVKKISSENVTPIGLGRTLTTAGEFTDLLREECVDILRPNIARHGFTLSRRIAALAETHYIAVAPYHDGGPLATAAALHLAASIPNFFIQQIPSPPGEKDRAMRRAILDRDVESVANGFAALANAPGLGVKVNERALEQYKENA